MNSKTTVILFSVLVILVGALTFRAFIAPAGNGVQLLGAGGNPQPYFVATNTNWSCGSATSTLVLAGGATGRFYVGLTNKDLNNNIYLCKANTCTASNGITLAPNGGAFEQKIWIDNYTGPYSCIADTATSTLTGSYTQ